MNISLYQLADQFRPLERLGDEDVPEEAIRDTLEALSGEIQIKATNIAKYAANLSMLANAVDEAAKAMKERAARINRRVSALHDYVRTHMEGCGITKIESPEFTITVVKNPPSVQIDSEAQIPAQFMVMPPPPPPPAACPDKKAIADAIKRGEEVPGAHLEHSTRLKVSV